MCQKWQFTRLPLRQNLRETKLTDLDLEVGQFSNRRPPEASVFCFVFYSHVICLFGVSELISYLKTVLESWISRKYVTIFVFSVLGFFMVKGNTWDGAFFFEILRFSGFTVFWLNYQWILKLSSKTAHCRANILTQLHSLSFIFISTQARRFGE